MITNASFRTKKLPDDITVAQVAEAAAAAASAASVNSSQSSPSVLTAQLGAITEENDEPSGGIGVKSSFRLSELVKKKSKPKSTKNKASSNNGGVAVQDGGSSHHPHSNDNNGVLIANPADWIIDTESKEEAEVRRRSNELYGSTQV